MKVWNPDVIITHNHKNQKYMVKRGKSPNWTKIKNICRTNMTKVRVLGGGGVW